VSESQIVVCELKDERYGIDIERVFEIIRLQPITVVPGAPGYVDGVINLRGHVIPVVDLAARFGLQRTSVTKASRIVVAGVGQARVGLVVDGVSEVLMIPDDAVEPAPAATTASMVGYVRGIAKTSESLVIMLDVDSLLELEVAMAERAA
jgi:purine-binding chemotaxis protein CheW